MFSPEFAFTYNRQKPYRHKSEDPMQQAVFESSDKWSERFSDLLIEYLCGKRISEDEASAVISEYSQWLYEDFKNNVSSVYSNFDDTSDDSEVVGFYQNVSQHILNYSFGELWLSTLTGNIPSKRSINNTQIDLAARSVNLMKPLFKKHENNELFTWCNKGKNNSHYKVSSLLDMGVMSVVTEIDAAVATLEACKENPGIIVLPAPHQFEHSTYNSELNIDLVEIDLLHRNAHGIQVKTGSQNSFFAKKYDERYVTTIYGELDLKNVLYLRQPDSSHSSPVPMPGLYSAHFLAGQRKLFRRGQTRGTHFSDSQLSHEMMRTQSFAKKFGELALSANEVVNSRMTAMTVKDLEIR